MMPLLSQYYTLLGCRPWVGTKFPYYDAVNIVVSSLIRSRVPLQLSSLTNVTRWDKVMSNTFMTATRGECCE